MSYVVLETQQAAAAAASGEEKQKTKFSSICVQVTIQSLPHAGARDDEVFSVRHLETASLKGSGNCSPDFLYVMIAAVDGGDRTVSLTFSTRFLIFVTLTQYVE